MINFHLLWNYTVVPLLQREMLLDSSVNYKVTSAVLT